MSDNAKTNIECPNCGTSFDVNEVLSHKLDEELRAKYESQVADFKRQIHAQQQNLEVEKKKLEEEKLKQAEAIENEVKQKLKAESEQLRQKLKAELSEESLEQMKALQNELNEKSSQLKEFNKAKVDIERLKREKEELRDSVEAEAARKLNEQIALEKEKIHKAEAEKNKLNLSEKEKVIEQLKEQLTIAQRKAEQGSMQLQGEVQELGIEQWLAEHYPLDHIEEIKKGARGADCLQVVNTHSRENCGSIYYESKRTQNFQPSWIEKFKNDIREKGADIGVLVTEAMPSDMSRMGLKEGVWICTFDELSVARVCDQDEPSSGHSGK